MTTEPFCVEILAEPLDLQRYVSFVSDPAAGAIATFLGVTRNHFEGRQVVRLEYEAYPPMATKLMTELCREILQKWKICRVAMGHRIGVVEVQQSSVIIAVSSSHRKEALEACAWAIDELKAKIPIWKKEFFKDGSVWKQNEECKTLWP